jgi:hypothetical protein
VAKGLFGSPMVGTFTVNVLTIGFLPNTIINGWNIVFGNIGKSMAY